MTKIFMLLNTKAASDYQRVQKAQLKIEETYLKKNSLIRVN